MTRRWRASGGRCDPGRAEAACRLVTGHAVNACTHIHTHTHRISLSLSGCLTLYVCMRLRVCVYHLCVKSCESITL